LAIFLAKGEAFNLPFAETEPLDEPLFEAGAIAVQMLSELQVLQFFRLQFLPAELSARFASRHFYHR